MNENEKRKVFEELLEEYQDVIASEFCYVDGGREAERKAWLNKYDGIKEPLIKDEKIRKAVREWADAVGIEEVAVMCHLVWDTNMTEMAKPSDVCLRIVFSGDLGIKMGTYTIAELCGEEEE